MCNVNKKIELEKAQTLIDCLGASRAARVRIEALDGLNLDHDIDKLITRAQAYRASVEENWANE